MLLPIHLFTPSQGILGDPSGVLGSCTPAKAHKLSRLRTKIIKSLNDQGITYLTSPLFQRKG